MTDIRPFSSFYYDGKPYESMAASVKAGFSDFGRRVAYDMRDGFSYVRETRRFGNASEWVAHFENAGSSQTNLCTKVYDCDVTLPLEFDPKPYSLGWNPPQTAARIYALHGSTWARDEWSSDVQTIVEGDTRAYSAEGGRSSQRFAPFFDINRGDSGYIVALGWTGQWTVEFARVKDGIRVRAGVQDAAFRVNPGESFRTMSVVILPYERGRDAAHNEFRRLVRERYSLIGAEGRDRTGPLCTMFWGAMPSGEMIKRINALGPLGHEYVWVDAGWYGNSSGECRNEFEGDWGMHTGDWNVNPNYHPDGMKEVVEAIKANGKKFLLWVEPERNIASTRLPTEHPEWFFAAKNCGDNRLLNLGNPDALEHITDVISDIIDELSVCCYRQDFNIDPLPFWRENDEPERAGMNEILHINGLYKFWDELLRRHPNLIIDNCSSGGRRIDIETVRRSMPMWRSDFQCVWNADPTVTQTHNTGLSYWLPYHGTGAGKVTKDDYYARSAFAASYVSNYFGYAAEELDESAFGWIAKLNDEYKRFREYADKDFYTPTPSPLDESNWCVWQYDDPEKGEGVVLAFRRPESPFDSMKLDIKGYGEGARFTFTDEDSKETTEGEKLLIEIPEKRMSRMIWYKVRV